MLSSTHDHRELATTPGTGTLIVQFLQIIILFIVTEASRGRGVLRNIFSFLGRALQNY